MTAPETGAQGVMVVVLITLLIASLVGMLYMLATEACREHYRRASVRFDRHADQAIEVTR